MFRLALEAFSNILMALIACSNSLWLFWTKSAVSLANNWNRRFSSREIFRPTNFPLMCMSSSNRIKGWEERTNRNGDKGSPCLTPLSKGKAWVNSQLTWTFASALRTSPWSRRITKGSSRMVCKVSHKKLWSILSYALAKSSLTHKMSCWVAWACSCPNFQASKLSIIHLPFTNPVCWRKQAKITHHSYFSHYSYLCD